MEKVKITDGIIRKIEKRLQKIIDKEYADGSYVGIDGIDISCWEVKDYSIEIKLRWGRMVDGKCVFQKQATLWMGDGNLDFIAGQFYQIILDSEE